VAYSPGAHSWREKIGRSVTDHLLDRRSFVVRLDSHTGYARRESGISSASALLAATIGDFSVANSVRRGQRGAQRTASAFR
jgi:hypothetical protein